MPKRKVEKPSEEYDQVTGVDYYNTKKGAIVLNAFNHKLRRKIIKTIHANKRLTVEGIYTRLGIAQAIASQQLRILRMAKIVTTKQQGHYIYYTINYSRLETLNKFVKKFTR